MDAPAEICVSCRMPLAGEYCHACGEQRAASHDLSLRAFLREAAESLINVDARGYRTFRALIARPGLLTAQYVEGVRRPWLTPIQLFLIANVVYFIYHSVVGSTALTTPLSSQVDGQIYSTLVQPVVDARFPEADPASYRAFEQRFNAASEAYAKSLVIIIAPLIAGLVALLRARHKEAFGKHFAFALHLLTVILLLLMALGIGFFMAGWVAFRVISPRAGFAVQSDTVFTPIMAALQFTYLFHAFRRAYGSSRAGAALLALALVVAWLPILHAYRLMLFLLVFYTV